MRFLNNGDKVTFEGTTYIVGGSIIATAMDSLHAGCVGTITEILTDEDRTFQSRKGPDIVCNFELPTDPDVLSELKRRCRRLFGKPEEIELFAGPIWLKPEAVYVLPIKEINLHPRIVQVLENKGWKIENTVLPCYGGIYHVSFSYFYSDGSYKGNAVVQVDFDGTLKDFVKSVEDAVSKYDPKAQAKEFSEKMTQNGGEDFSSEDVLVVSGILTGKVVELVKALQDVVRVIDYLTGEASLDELEDLLDYQITGDMVEDGLETKVEEALAELSYARFDSLLLRIRTIQSLRKNH